MVVGERVSGRCRCREVAVLESKGRDHYFSGGMGMKILEIPGANLNGKKFFWNIWVYLERLSSFWEYLKIMFHSLLSKIQTGSFG